MGKTAIVTGGYSGIGLETTRALAEAGVTLVVPARTQEKARTALDGIPRVEVETLELIDPASIDAFAGRFLGSDGRWISSSITPGSWLRLFSATRAATNPSSPRIIWGTSS